jgi:hypothetical protein
MSWRCDKDIDDTGRTEYHAPAEQQPAISYSLDPDLLRFDELRRCFIPAPSRSRQL